MQERARSAESNDIHPSAIERDKFTLQTDPAADAVVSVLLGPWEGTALQRASPQWKRLAQIGELVLGAQLRNEDLGNWSTTLESMDDRGSLALSQFLREASRLPTWADKGKVDRAGELFRRHGSTCSIILFCASLPEVYASNSITEVLNTSKQLESRAAARIRSTGSLVLPIMIEGGLTSPGGAGVASIVKARLIHAIVRNLILRSSPQAALERLGPNGCIPSIPRVGDENAYEAMYCSGWDMARSGLPCNQREQSYVILCFSHVLVRSLRRLGVVLTPQDEEAFFHAWNVVAALIGVDESMMAWTSSEAEAMFQAHQRTVAKLSPAEDWRPAHARALIATMAGVIRGNIFKQFPELLMRMLCDAPTLAVLGLERPPPMAASIAFKTAMRGAVMIDTISRSLGLASSAIETIVDTMGDRFITEILKLNLDELRAAMGKASAYPTSTAGSSSIARRLAALVRGGRVA